MLTLRLTDLLLMILTAIACVASIYIVLMVRKMTAVLDDWRKTSVKIDAVIPDIRTLCTTTEEAMRSVKGLADQGTRVAGDVAEVTDELKVVVEDALARVHGLMKAFDTIGMLISSFSAGLAAVQAMKCCSDHVSDPDGPSEETDDEERDV